MNGLSSEILFEKFQIIEVLKKDEHAAVFLANHIYLSKKIILKILNTQKISDSTLVERFKREAKILAKLDSPNIIKVLDFGMFKEFFYISFEYIEGSSARNLLKNSSLSIEQKKHLMIQLLKGLYYAHENQIIHRDIKPENIFIDNNLNLKIGDFGLALSAEDNFVTNPYSIVGTPSYMSPEQVRGAKLNAQSDLFSAGVVLYEFFVGKNPFLKDNVSLTLNEIMAFDESEIANGIKEQPQEIKDVLYHLLRKNPKDRYNSALDALNDLGISIDQPTIVINLEEKHSQKNIIWGIAALVTIGVIIVVWFLIKTSDNTSHPIEPNVIPQSNQEQQTEKNIPSPAGENKKVDNIDSSNFNKPLIKNPTQQVENQSQVNQGVNQQTQVTKPSENKPIQYGFLDIICNSNTKIFINGEMFDEAPVQKPISLQEGSYNLKLTNPEFPPYDTTFTIRGKETTKLQVNLNSQVGFLNIDSRPVAKVYFGSVFKGETPLTGVKVVPDALKIILRQTGYQDADTVINVQKGARLNLRFRLQKK